MSKKILTLDNVLVINKKIGKIDTIEKLKASTIYSLGDVVEVLGFHTKGDGSHHKRIAKSEDDGSGEQGQNGIWWCIVHSGEVNVSWFGENIQKALNVADTVVFDKNLNLNISSEEETLKPKSYQKIIFKQNINIVWGQNKAPYFPLFLLKNVEYCEIENLTSIWEGGLDWGSFGANGTVVQYGINTLARSFATVIGLYNSKEIKIKNSKSLSKDGGVYDAFVRNLGGSSNITIDNIFLSHYNNAFSDGFTNSRLSNILGVKRSNKVNEVGGAAFYGPSHLIYSGANGTIIENIQEIGESMNDGDMGGATIQLVSPKNVTINNVITKMKNTPTLMIKGDSFDNLIISNLTCDCFDWTDIDVESSVGFTTGPNATNVIMDNVSVRTYNNDLTAIRVGGINSVFTNIVVESIATKTNKNPLVFLNGANDCTFDVKVKNSGNTQNCLLYMSNVTKSEIKLDCKGNGYVKSGNHPKTGATWGSNLNNDITFVVQKNLPPIQIQDLTVDEQKLNCITRDNFINNQLSHSLSAPAKEISKEFLLHRNGAFLVNITIRHGVNHAQNITGILLLEDGTNKFANFAELTNVKKGSGNNYITTVTPKMENNMPSVLVETTCPYANLEQIELFYADLCNFYN